MFTDKKPHIYFEKSGSGKPLILVHGNKEDHRIFDKLVDALKDDFTIYAVDSRGHGKSEKATEYHYSDMADDIFNLIDEQNLVKPYFYGFSDGAIIGIICALKCGDCFERMVLSGANINVNGLKTLPLLGMRLSALLTQDDRTRMMLKEPNISAKELKNISCDTLVTAGEFDLIKPSHTRLIYESIPNCTLKIIKGKGHGDYVVNSDFMADILKGFFAF